MRKIYDKAFKEKAVQLIYGNKLISKEQMKLEIFEYMKFDTTEKGDILL